MANIGFTTKKVRGKLFFSVTLLLLLVSLCVSATFAWFTLSLPPSTTRLVAGRLDADLYLLSEIDMRPDYVGSKYNIQKDYNSNNEVNFAHPSSDVDSRANSKLVDLPNALPGDSGYRVLRLVNNGSVAFLPTLRIISEDIDSALAESLTFNVVYSDSGNPAADSNGNVTKSFKISSMRKSGDNYVYEVALSELTLHAALDIRIEYSIARSLGNNGQEGSVTFDFVMYLAQNTQIYTY